jgi:hypothetical protein
LATIQGNPPDSPFVDYSKAEITIIPEELASVEPAVALPELLADSRPTLALPTRE